MAAQEGGDPAIEAIRYRGDPAIEAMTLMQLAGFLALMTSWSARR